MKKVAIVIDSSYNIRPNEYTDVYVLGVELIEEKDGQQKTYKEFVDIDNKIMSEKQISGSFFKTSQPSVGDLIKLLEKIQDDYDVIYGLPLPKTISGAFNTWKTIENEFPKFKVFNQPLVGHLSRWMIQDFVKAKEQNKLDEKFINEYIENMNKNRLGMIIVPDIKFLKHGGRVSNAKSFFINLAKLKLLISLNPEGLLFRTTATSTQSAVNKAAEEISKLLGLDNKKIKRMCVYINKHAEAKYNFEEYIKLVKERFNYEKLEIDSIPCIIMAHTGPNFFVIGIDVE